MSTLNEQLTTCVQKVPLLRFVVASFNYNPSVILFVTPNFLESQGFEIINRHFHSASSLPASNVQVVNLTCAGTFFFVPKDIFHGGIWSVIAGETTAPV